MKKIVLFFLLLNFFMCFSQENRIIELQRIISDSEKISNVSARSNINQYWELVDLLFQNNRPIDAYNILLKGLSLDPWNYKYQNKAAEYEISQQKYLEANTRLDFITKNLQESYEIYTLSMKQKNSIVENVQIINNQGIQLSLDSKYFIYLVTYPYISDQLIDVVSSRISIEYGIQVKIINMGVDESIVGIRNPAFNDEVRQKPLQVF